VPKTEAKELKNERERLYKLFLKNPRYTQLAVEIKVFDDKLAAWAEQPMSMNVSSK
jgi:hypothetical protein